MASGLLTSNGMTEANKRVLIVDDEIAILKLVRESLVSLLFCEVDTTPDPEYAFELFLKRRYDLLILDLCMPNIDGALLYSLIRKVCLQFPTQYKLPPLLLMTGNASSRRAQELLRESGARGRVVCWRSHLT